MTEFPQALELQGINSYMNAVMLQVLSIGETVEEVSDSGFLAQAPTIKTQLLADDSMLQVTLAAYYFEGKEPTCCFTPCHLLCVTTISCQKWPSLFLPHIWWMNPYCR